MKWNDNDLSQIRQHGQQPETVEQQIKYFETGFSPVHLLEAATVENRGIRVFSEKETDAWVAFYDHEAPLLRVILFVPASGAASRMFKSLFAFLDDEKDGQGSDVQQFIESLQKFAFYDDLKEMFRKTGKDIENESFRSRVAMLLQEEGLNYGNLPKGLLRFHKYDHENRRPIEEHLVEGASYGKDKDNRVHLHFTVSPEHKEAFRKAFEQVLPEYEKRFGVIFDISFSEQKPSTDTIAVNPDNTPFRNRDGALLFRPAGHGALIENLNDLKADLVFVKNIDNVVPDRLKGETIRYKKALGGFLLRKRNEVYSILNLLDGAPEEGIKEALFFVEEELHAALPSSFSGLSIKEKYHYLYRFLNRPIRVCGMVKNEGEPGGGPFLVEDAEGNRSLQIVEASQINMKDSRQASIVKSATHFNPVDLVCSIKDYTGKPFDLLQFVDPLTGFISEKSKDGKVLKAQELPGLWNGAMAQWITFFVEVPLITFNPVKTINDLLRPEHQ